MRYSFDIEVQNSGCRYGSSPNRNNDTIPMHPDDFHALLSWIQARRFHDDEENDQVRPANTGKYLLVG